VLSRAGSDEQRQSARKSLETRLAAKELEPWVECWCRVAIGRSLLREQDSEHKRQGVIQLLHAPARFVRVAPHVAGIALAESAVALHGMGDDTGASALKAELLDRFPRSPAAAWGALRDIRTPNESSARAGGTPPAGAASEVKGGGGGAKAPGGRQGG